MDAVVSAGTLQPLAESKEVAQHSITETLRVVAITHTTQHNTTRENERAHSSVSPRIFLVEAERLIITYAHNKTKVYFA
jgi:hypothetical protein